METKLESEGKLGTQEQETGEHPEGERSLLPEATAVPPTPTPVKGELPRWEGAGPSRDPKFNCAWCPVALPSYPWKCEMPRNLYSSQASRRAGASLALVDTPDLCHGVRVCAQAKPG